MMNNVVCSTLLSHISENRAHYVTTLFTQQHCNNLCDVIIYVLASH